MQILSLGDKELAGRFAAYRAALSDKIVKANEELRTVEYKYKTN